MIVPTTETLGSAIEVLKALLAFFFGGGAFAASCSGLWVRPFCFCVLRFLSVVSRRLLELLAVFFSGFIGAFCFFLVFWGL